MQTSQYESEEFKAGLEIDAQVQEFNQKPITSLCIWHDICGWGSVLKEMDWDLEKIAQSPKTHILRNFYMITGDPSIVSLPPQKSERVLVINDGVAKALDLTLGNLPSIVQFAFYLRDLAMRHCIAKQNLTKWGVSVRTVAAGGARLQYTIAVKTGHSYLSYGDTISKAGAAFLKETLVYYPSEFQMNTAFAKAFTIESGGTKCGVTVGGCFIENTYLEHILKAFPENAFFENNQFLFGQTKASPMIIFKFSQQKELENHGKKFYVRQLVTCDVTTNLESDSTTFDLG